MQFGNATKIGLSWFFVVSGGIYAFVLAKRNIDTKRYDHMKVRERMRKSNVGTYPESSRKF